MDIGQGFIVQTAILLIAIIGIIISIIMMAKYKNKRGWVVPPLTFFINVFLFTIILHLEYITGNYFLSFQWTLIWSAAIRLHALLLGITYVIIPMRS